MKSPNPQPKIYAEILHLAYSGKPARQIGRELGIDYRRVSAILLAQGFDLNSEILNRENEYVQVIRYFYTDGYALSDIANMIQRDVEYVEKVVTRMGYGQGALFATEEVVQGKRTAVRDTGRPKQPVKSFPNKFFSQPRSFVQRGDTTDGTREV